VGFCSRRTIFVKLIFALELRVADRTRLALPQPTEWQRIADSIDAARVRMEFVARRASRACA
jgi:hypothetical protein